MTETIEDDIIAGIMGDFNKSNMQDHNLAEVVDIGKTIAMILSDSPERHQVASSIGFDPVQMYFARKFLGRDIIERRIHTKREDYFKATVYLDMFSTCIVEGTEIFDEMEKRTRQLEEIDPYLDLDLELCVRCCSLTFMAEYKQLANNDRRRNNYNSGNGQVFTDYAAFRKTDPIQTAAARLFVEQVQADEIKSRLGLAQGISDLSASLFIDINLSYYEKIAHPENYEQAKQEVFDLVDNGEHLKAAHLSMEYTAKKMSREPLSRYVSTIEPTRY